jgi:Xaa-Pro aminopeptidase
MVQRNMLLTHIPQYFKARRDRLMNAHPGAAFLFPSAQERLRNPDVPFPFRQESNFYYLSGFDEPESFLALVPAASTPKGSAYRTILFVRKRDPEKEMWEGERYGIEGAHKIFGADEAYLIEELDKKLPELLKGSDQVFYRLGVDESMDRRVLAVLEIHRKSLGRSGKGLQAILDPSGPLAEMRLFKSAEEVEILRKACQMTAQAHKALMKEVRPGMNECEVEALIDYSFRKSGCQRVGYGSIVAGGKNATCLHYRSNNEILRAGELLLIDAGGELDYYTADITRTFPIGKRFSPAQAKVYDLVLKSQTEAIAMTKPGVKITDIHKRVCEILVEGFLLLGLLKGKSEDIFKTNEFRRFYPHNTSHWLGMDVHDVGLYIKDEEPRALEPGMVFTIEPGFYAQPTDKEVPEPYRNLGIRIEDNILVTSSGCEVLTKGVPKSRDEIESLRDGSAVRPYSN